MSIRKALFAVIGGLAVLAAPALAAKGSHPAVDLAKVDRTVRRQPAYRTAQPRYCLVVFGPDAKYRVWLVLDGGMLYVDRNGDGDLTEPGKSTKSLPAVSDAASFLPITIYRPDGKTEESLSFVLYGWHDFTRGKYTDKVSPSFHVTWKGRLFGSWGDETGPCVWGTTPRTAPVLFVDGPLRMGFEVPAASAFQSHNDGACSVEAGVGTPGLGSGAFVHMAYTHNAIPANVHPIAVVQFANRNPAGPPIRAVIVLRGRC